MLIIVAVASLFAVTAFASANVGAQQSQQMVASWYGPGFEGASTASGAPFDPNGYTAAHKTLAFGTKLIVTYNGASVVVEITDRGPFIAGRDLDLSQGAADYIGLTPVGEDVVDVTYADASTPVGPYSGTTAPAPQQQTAPQQDQVTVDQTQNAGQSSVQRQYEENNVADDQYNVVDEQYDFDDIPTSGDTEAVSLDPTDFVVPETVVDIEEAPPVEKVSPIIDEVYEAPKVVYGLTVLPDTGGLPLLPLAGVAATLLLGGGLAFGLLRR